MLPDGSVVITYVVRPVIDVPGLDQSPAVAADRIVGGDVLTLLAISPQFANAVTLKGHVAQPLRYPYTPGMRVRDLIPDRDALVTPDFYRRKNLLVQIIDEDDDDRPTPTRVSLGRRPDGPTTDPREAR